MLVEDYTAALSFCSEIFTMRYEIALPSIAIITYGINSIKYDHRIFFLHAILVPKDGVKQIAIAQWPRNVFNGHFPLE